MADVAITRTQVVVIDSVGENQYHDMPFRDKEGKDYKISAKRVQYFKEIIQPNAAVQLNYAMSSFGKEYIYSAVQVKDGLPPLVKATTVPVPPLVQEAQKMGATVVSTKEMTKDDWNDKDKRTRKSIERQTALNAAVRMGEMLTNAEIEVFKINKETGKLTVTSEKIIATAKVFESYLEGKEV